MAIWDEFNEFLRWRKQQKKRTTGSSRTTSSKRRTTGWSMPTANRKTSTRRRSAGRAEGWHGHVANDAGMDYEKTRAYNLSWHEVFMLPGSRNQYVCLDIDPEYPGGARCVYVLKTTWELFGNTAKRMSMLASTFVLRTGEIAR